MYQTILVPIDLSEETLTQKVVPHINALSQTDNPDFYFISAIYAPSFFIASKIVYSKQPIRNDDEIVQQALQTLQSMTKKFAIREEKVHCLIKAEPPRDAILEIADEVNADLIVIASRRPNFKTHLLGSTAAAVVNYAKIPVLVIR
jgi:universal stress protein F